MNCSIEGCENSVKARGLCSGHAHRLERYGSPTGIPVPRELGVCSVDGCNRLARSGKSKFCNRHYRRLIKYGDALGGLTFRGGPREWIYAHTNHSDIKCLSWPFSRAQDGYGYLERRFEAHRIMCELVNGAPPTPKHEAAHSCGNGHLGCVNPRHLSWKTRAENQADRISHGTSNRGERSPNAKLTTANVIEIRRRLSEGEMVTRIAIEYGVNHRTVSAIKHNKGWAWL